MIHADAEEPLAQIRAKLNAFADPDHPFNQSMRVNIALPQNPSEIERFTQQICDAIRKAWGIPAPITPTINHVTAILHAAGTKRTRYIPTCITRDKNMFLVEIKGYIPSDETVYKHFAGTPLQYVGYSWTNGVERMQFRWSPGWDK